MGSSSVAAFCLTPQSRLIKPLRMQIKKANEQTEPSDTREASGGGEDFLGAAISPAGGWRLLLMLCAPRGGLWHGSNDDGCRKERCLTQ